MFYVLKVKGYRFLGRLFPFKQKRRLQHGHLTVTVYKIFQNRHNATIEAKKLLSWCDSIDLIETERITRTMFLRQLSSCAIFKGCKAKIRHQCKNDYRIHLWYDPSNEGVGFYCETAIREMAKTRYPLTLRLEGHRKPHRKVLKTFRNT